MQRYYAEEAQKNYSDSFKQSTSKQRKFSIMQYDNKVNQTLCSWGEQNLPAKRMFPVALCLMKNRKGWSALKTSVTIAERLLMTAEVAETAVVPSSFTDR